MCGTELQRLSAEEVVEDQHRRIVDGLGEAICRRGYDATTVEQIIRVAGVSRRTFYDLFAGKGDAFCAAHEEALGLLGRRVRLACEAESEWPGEVAAAIAACLEWAVAEQCRARLIAGDPLSVGPYMAYCHDRLVGQFGPGLRCGSKVVRVDVSPTQEEALLAGLAGVVAPRLIRGQATSLPALAPQLTELVLTPYLGAVGAQWIAARA